MSNSQLERFWQHAARSKLETKFALAEEMRLIGRLATSALSEILLQYRYFTRAFATDLALLVARCPEGRLRSLLAELLNEELGNGDPEESHLRLYDRFLESIGAVERDAGSVVLANGIAPQVRDLLNGLNDRTRNRSAYYALGMRGLGGECVCGVYFGVMYGYLRRHPFMVANADRIDWKFWEIHAGHADIEHDVEVRNAVAELLVAAPGAAIDDMASGYEYGTSVWDAFWDSLFRPHVDALRSQVAGDAPKPADAGPAEPTARPNEQRI